MGITAITLFAMLAFQNTTLAKAYLEILTPPELCSTNSNHIFIVGKTNAQLVGIKINNQNYSEVIVKDSIFHYYVEFGYGLNEILITPIISGQTISDNQTVSIDILSSPNISKKFENIFKNYKFHNLRPNNGCINCHSYECEDPELMDTSKPCYDCHGRLEQQFTEHMKDRERTCVICHKLKQDLTITGSNDSQYENPCFYCHKDKIGKFAQEYIHGPVAGGSCVICHNPHGSEFEKNLRSSQIILCASCHSIVEENWNKETQHNPFHYGKCSKCHDPHSTSNKWVLIKNSKDVCMGCHKDDDLKIFHKHPYNVKPKKELATKLKLTSTGLLECISCHNPHASNTEHLLRVTENITCIGCHSDR